ncbi:MAG: DegQ family serine endoprotease [Alphaproteobacteria bacterium]|nr:DegQ family serine endoprotease [Alphaproteobacteria bacterium]
MPYLNSGIRALALGAALIVLPAAGAAARGAPDSFADLAEKLLPTVVNISTVQKVEARAEPNRRGVPAPQLPPGSPFEEFFKEFFDRNNPDRGGNNNDGAPQRRAQSLGSGFIIDAGGTIVTNNHVIEGADEISVTLHDNTRLKAKLVARDPKTDLAVLKVESAKPLPATKWGASDRARVGEWVLAIGNPFGLGGTVTAGILSARSRDINAGAYDDFLQTDAPINRGNSGGPLFNMAGEVIGVNSAIYSPTGGSVGIGFAIPSALAQNVVASLRDHGRVRRGWLGVRIQTVTDELAEGLGLQKKKGALVASVQDGSPARQSGIEAGDIILTFNGKEVNEMRGLPRIVAETEIDRSVKVEVWRKGKPMTFTVKVGELPEDDKLAAGGPARPGGAAEGDSALGMTLSRITPELRQKFGIKDDVKGVVVTALAANSAAATEGIRIGDVIVEVAQEEVGQPKDVVDRVAQAKGENKRSVLLMTQRAGEIRFVALRIDRG